MESLIRQFANVIRSELGSGYSERVYHNAFEVMLRQNGISYETERIIPIVFMGHTIGNLRADLIIDKDLIVELKSVKNIGAPMIVQVNNYLKLTGLKKGILINFGGGPGCEFEVCDKSSETIE